MLSNSRVQSNAPEYQSVILTINDRFKSYIT